MNNKAQLNVGTVVMLAVGIILGAVFMVSVVDQQSLLTDKQPVTDEQHSLSSCYTGGNQVNESNTACNVTVDQWYVSGDWRASEGQCNLESVVVTNSTGGLVLVVETDYNLFADSGVIQFLNTTDTEALGSNLTLVDYNFCDSGYNKDSSSRGLARTFSLFFALIVLAFAVVGVREWVQRR